MNSLAIVAFFVAVASTSAGLISTPSAEIIQGPSSRSTVVGPDGSSISSISPGGTIISENHGAIVAGALPVVAARAAPLAYSAPLLSSYSALASPIAYSAQTYSAPVAYAAHGYSAPAYTAHAYAAPAYAAHSYSAPALAAYATPIATRTSADTVVAGPSGTIATSKSVDSPALVAAYGVHGLYY